MVSFRRRVIVKFRDDLGIPYKDGAESFLVENGLGEWPALAAEFPGVTLKRLFVSLDPARIQSALHCAERTDPTYRKVDLLSYFALSFADGQSERAIAERIGGWSIVERAYAEGGPADPPWPVNPANDPHFGTQDYVKSPPAGIGAEYAWGFPGGDGEGIEFIDVEQGWHLDHEDLVAVGVTLQSGLNQTFKSHGTKCLGIVCAEDNDKGCVGIAPGAGPIHVVSEWRTAADWNLADAITVAALQLQFGDVLLIESQTSAAAPIFEGPVEIEQHVFDAIRLATALGVVVVEPAGNGGHDLDAFVDASGKAILKRGGPATGHTAPIGFPTSDFRDSVAIMVAAAKAHTKNPGMSTCFGTRIDCFAAGSKVTTTGHPADLHVTNAYHVDFGGTSAASAIVAGAALVLQGLAQARFGFRLSPKQVRLLLAMPSPNNLSADPDNDRIGVKPDLEHLLATALAAFPDVYLRDHVGDDGDPHQGVASMSPDVFVRTDAIADADAAFGATSGTANRDDLGASPSAGQACNVFVRVLNRGGAPAHGVTATVYFTPPSSLAHPAYWQLVGTSPSPATVDPVNLLKVLAPIPWVAPNVPGGYCLIAIVDSLEDPAPNDAEFDTMAKFARFVRQNNNVAWRNVTVLPAIPVGGTSTAEMSFSAAGAPDSEEEMTLELVARLPKKSTIELVGPAPFIERIAVDSGRLSTAEDGGVLVSLPPNGASKFREATFGKKEIIPLRIVVRLPRSRARGLAGTVFARQLWRGQEVGRVTWRIEWKERSRGAGERSARRAAKKAPPVRGKKSPSVRRSAKRRPSRPKRPGK